MINNYVLVDLHPIVSIYFIKDELRNIELFAWSFSYRLDLQSIIFIINPKAPLSWFYVDLVLSAIRTFLNYTIFVVVKLKLKLPKKKKTNNKVYETNT